MAEATSLLKSLSVPEPLRSQLVEKSRLGFMLILDADGVMELISESCSEIIGHEAAQIQGDKIYNYLKKVKTSQHSVTFSDPHSHNMHSVVIQRTTKFIIQSKEILPSSSKFQLIMIQYPGI